MTTTFKAVRVIGENLFASAMAGGKARVRYELGLWSVPPPWLKSEGYGLFSFNSVVTAAAFLSGPVSLKSGYAVLECEAEQLVESLPVELDLDRLFSGEIHEYKPYQLWPKGTVMSMMLRPVRLLTLDELCMEWDKR